MQKAARCTKIQLIRQNARSTQSKLTNILMYIHIYTVYTDTFIELMTISMLTAEGANRSNVGLSSAEANSVSLVNRDKLAAGFYRQTYITSCESPLERVCVVIFVFLCVLFGDCLVVSASEIDCTPAWIGTMSTGDGLGHH